MSQLPNTPAQNAAFDVLLKATQTEIPRIEEAVFVRNYLPILASKEQGVDLTPWLEVCGHFYRPVDVVKNDVVLFRVPALLRQSPVNPPRSAKDSVDERIKTSRLKALVHPRLGKTYFAQEMGKLVGRTPPDLETANAWNEILKRYGYETLPLQSSGGSSAPTNDNSDIEGYDDL